MQRWMRVSQRKTGAMGHGFMGRPVYVDRRLSSLAAL
jgi:hypothetical protein